MTEARPYPASLAGRPCVSVITPSLDAAARLADCLDSVARQTYPNVEHIVVDGGSTDATVELLRARGLRFVSEPDRGQSDAINKGFALATGQYLCWLNADDLLLPDAIQVAADAFARDPAVGWVYGDCDVRREGRPAYLLRPPPRLGRHAFDGGNVLAQPGTLVARWALERVGQIDEAFELAMDLDLWLRLLDAGVPAAYVPRTLAVFDIHPGSKTGSLGTEAFMREEARALCKSGRRSEALLAYGRAAVAASRDAKNTVEPVALQHEVARLTAGLAGELSEREGRLVADSARVEAGLLELHGSVRGLRHLTHPGPWRHAVTRRRLAAAAGRRGASALAGLRVSRRSR